MMNEAGAAIVRQTIAHTPEGFLELEASCHDPHGFGIGLDKVQRPAIISPRWQGFAAEQVKQLRSGVLDKILQVCYNAGVRVSLTSK